MEKKLMEYMRIGHKAEYAGKEYSLLDSIKETCPTVKAVDMSNKCRYELLRAWSQNHVGVTDAQRKEMLSYEEQIPTDALVPSDKIRFITSDYKTKFEVKNFDFVIVNEKKVQVAYLDAYHFAFVGQSLPLWGGCFHICHFAEICERNGNHVAPIQKSY